MKQLVTESTNSPKESLHTFCFACSQINPLGLHLHFNPPIKNCIQGETIVPRQFQGYNNIVHGGIISTILDSAMTNLLLELDIIALTVDLNVRFSKPMQINERADVHASLTHSRSSLHELKAEIIQNNHRIAHARARFMEPENGEGVFSQNKC